MYFGAENLHHTTTVVLWKRRVVSRKEFFFSETDILFLGKETCCLWEPDILSQNQNQTSCLWEPDILSLRTRHPVSENQTSCLWEPDILSLRKKHSVSGRGILFLGLLPPQAVLDPFRLIRPQKSILLFLGHSDVVKDIHIQDSEHLFLSASRDKTVKLWLLSNHGDGTGQSACSWTTYDHRKPVFAVDVIDVMRQAVSCDGSIHVSTFGNCVKQFISSYWLRCWNYDLVT